MVAQIYDILYKAPARSAWCQPYPNWRVHCAANVTEPEIAIAPSPRGGEGRGEGAPALQKQAQCRSPLTLARYARSTSPPWGEVNEKHRMKL
jgi:hypothetical protein